MSSNKSNNTEKKTEDRYKTNPFLIDMVVPVKDTQVKLSKLGKDKNILINQDTGEVRGTHVTTYKQVDGEQFVKLFTANIALTFDLTSAGIKTFGVLLWSVQHKALAKDEVCLDTYTREAFIDFHKEQKKQMKISQPTFGRGLAELTKAQIIAKTLRKGIYFINPNFVFNGDRIAFTTLIERNHMAGIKKVVERRNFIEKSEEEQQEMPFE